MAKERTNPDRNFLAEQSADDAAAELFGSPPLPLNEVIDNPVVQERVARVIALAMDHAVHKHKLRR